jgi:tetratricopeptide (TPR) repeat protein
MSRLCRPAPFVQSLERRLCANMVIRGWPMRRGYVASVCTASIWLLVFAPVTAGAQSPAQWRTCNSSVVDVDAGIEACTAIIDSGSLDGRQMAIALNNRGTAYWTKGNRDQALTNYSDAIKANPNFAIAYSNRGLVKYEKGDFDAAITDFNEAIKLNPTNDDHFLRRGDTWKAKGDNEKAFADLEQAIKLNPNHAMAFISRGDILRDKGELDRAITEYNLALKADPTMAAAQTGLGLAYERKGNIAQARRAYQAALNAPAKHRGSAAAHRTARERLRALPQN